MDENKYTDLFASFNPELSSDKLFMARLQANLRAVSNVKEQVSAMRSKSRLAVWIAAIIGFICGILCSLCYQAIFEVLNGLFVAGSTFAILFADYGNVVVWGIICLMTGVIAYSAYDITLLATKKDLIRSGFVDSQTHFKKSSY